LHDDGIRPVDDASALRSRVHMDGAIRATTSYRYATVRPLGTADQVELHGGILGDRARRNAELSLAHAVERFEAAGNLSNLRVAGGQPGGFQPSLTLDADVYKWLEAAAWELRRGDSGELRSLYDEVASIVLAAQSDDGYLNSWFQVVEPDRRFMDLTRGCEMYCAGHLIEAGVVAAACAGDERLLAAAERFADLLDTTFGPEGRAGVDGHEEVELALVALYRHTDEERYLRLAQHLVDQRGHGLVGPGVFGPRYYQDHAPVREASTLTGHAVRAMYLNTGVTDVYLETGDRSLLQAMETQWRAMTRDKQYLTGGLGSRERDEAIGEPYELPPDRSYCETCAAAGLIFWSWRMLLATGDREYADMLERVLYNAFLVGVGADGVSYFYANPLEVRAEHEPPHESTWRGETPWYLSPAPEQTGNRRRSWFPCACCPPNVMRVLASLDRYLLTTSERAIQIQQYVAGAYAVTLADGDRVAFTLLTEYPWDGEVRIRIDEAPEAAWTLSLRIPGWTRTPSLWVNGDPVLVRDGYTGIERTWSPGDEIHLDLAISPRLTAPSPRASAIRGCVAIERGPLVYCLEEEDHGDVNLADLRLPLDSVLTSEASDLFGGSVVVHADAFVASAEPDDWPYASIGDPVPQSVPARITAIPYYLWANRRAGAMRVWIPAAPATTDEGYR
jgi:DUF1680 family protein